MGAAPFAPAPLIAGGAIFRPMGSAFSVTNASDQAGPRLHAGASTFRCPLPHARFPSAGANRKLAAGPSSRCGPQFSAMGGPAARTSGSPGPCRKSIEGLHPLSRGDGFITRGRVARNLNSGLGPPSAKTSGRVFRFERAGFSDQGYETPGSPSVTRRKVRRDRRPTDLRPAHGRGPKVGGRCARALARGTAIINGASSADRVRPRRARYPPTKWNWPLHCRPRAK